MTTVEAVERLERDSHSDACDHADVDYVGQDATAFFYRCRTCGSITITQGGQLWTLRPKVVAAGGAV